MRPNRPITPSHHHHSSHTALSSNHSPAPSSAKKYYSREEVSQILKVTFDSKLAQFKHDLDNNQKLIKKLNEQLAHNDKMLQHAHRLLGDHLQTLPRSQHEETAQIVHRVLNQKMGGLWSQAKVQLESIRAENERRAKMVSERIEAAMMQEIHLIRNKCEQHIEMYKKKNNAYWLKIKETLNKLNSRIVASEDSVGALGQQMSKFEQEMHRDADCRKKIEMGKKSGVMLLELKKSVTNVCRNFQDVLRLQEGMKDRFNKVDGMNGDGMNGDNSRLCWKCGMHRSSSGKDEIVMLEYSADEYTVEQDLTIYTNHDNMVNRVNNNQNNPNNNPTHNNNYKQINQNNNDKINQNKQNNHINSIKMTMMSPTNIDRVDRGRISSSISNPIGEYYINSNNMEEDYEQSLKSPLAHPHADSFNLNNPNNNSRASTTQPKNSSGSFLNFSLDGRKEMGESIKPRLLETMEAKNLKRPLKVHLDNINYLKNEEGNYLFDLSGNMFKCSHGDFRELEGEGIIVRASTKKGAI